MAEELETVAPYLVELPFKSKHIDDILKSYGQNGCLFFCTPLAFDKALERVRDIFIVQGENGSVGYLRFYSPDIFRTLIDKHNLEHLQLIFKQIMYFYCESEANPLVLNRYRYNGKSIEIDAFSLEEKTAENLEG